MKRAKLNPRKILVASAGVATLSYLGVACDDRGPRVEPTDTSTSPNTDTETTSTTQPHDAAVPNASVANLVVAPPIPSVANLVAPPSLVEAGASTATTRGVSDGGPSDASAVGESDASVASTDASMDASTDAGGDAAVAVVDAALDASVPTILPMPTVANLLIQMPLPQSARAPSSEKNTAK